MRHDRGARRSLGDASSRQPQQKETDRGDGTTDDLKGRVKEAGGDLTGDQGLKNEGKVDQASGKVKDAVGDVADKAKDVVNRD